jgi:ribonuclease M5
LDEKRTEFTVRDLFINGLEGSSDAVKRRDFVGKELGIGYGNAKQFLSRLNRYGITRKEFEAAVNKLEVIE